MTQAPVTAEVGAALGEVDAPPSFSQGKGAGGGVGRGGWWPDDSGVSRDCGTAEAATEAETVSVRLPLSETARLFREADNGSTEETAAAVNRGGGAAAGASMDLCRLDIKDEGFLDGGGGTCLVLVCRDD